MTFVEQAPPSAPGVEGEPKEAVAAPPEQVGGRQTDTRALAEAAKGAALSVALYLFLLPLLGGFALPVAALPVVVVSVRRGVRAGLLCSLAAAIVSGLLLGPVKALVLASFLLLVGMAQGTVLHRGLSVAIAVLAGAAGAALFLVFNATLAFYLTGLNVVTEQLKETQAIMATVKQYYLASGMDPDQVKREFAVLERSVKMLPSLLPALVGMIALLFAGLNVLLVGRILRALGEKPLDLPRFADWQVPWWLAWGCLLGLAGYLFGGDVLPSQAWIKPAGLNLLLFFGVIFGVQGLSVGYFFLERWGLPMAVRWLILGLIFIFLSPVLLWLGLLDVWFNYRKLEVPESS